MVRTIIFFSGLVASMWVSVSTHNHLISAFYLGGIVLGIVLEKFKEVE